MAGAVRHRGPDGWGLYTDRHVGLAHTRLSIIDLAGGAQPLASADGRVVVTYNGEVYNYLELRAQLEALGHRFRTRTDTEVLLHGYQQWGSGMLERFNGQFAFALWDHDRDTLLLARDRFGVRPLFYAEWRGDFYFASEAKALFATQEVPAIVDLEGLDEIFTMWGVRAPGTAFSRVRQLEPGTWATWQAGSLRTGRYYDLCFPEASEEPRDALASLDHLLRSSVTLRLRSDVPVGGYLSGGLDSSITCALAAASSPHTLRTFSVTFEDPHLDESEFQRMVATDLRSSHHVTHITPADVARVFPEVVYHAETPMVRAAPAPMYLLARRAREEGITVVLTGEGADELFLGYDLFKETAVRLFCHRQPSSRIRLQLFRRLYPYLAPAGCAGDFWPRFFLSGGTPEDPLFSHVPRFRLTSKIRDFFTPAVRAVLGDGGAIPRLRRALPDRFATWSPLNRAAYLELVTLLPSYLLSSQGERMAMAHGVEARFPFLDHRLFEFAASLPTSSRLLGLREKDILRRWARGVVPARVRARHKQPYRAPDVPAFFGAGQPPYAAELLAPEALRRAGIFDPVAVAGLVRRCAAGRATGVAENQALVAILSTQLWHHQFIDGNALPRAAMPRPGTIVRADDFRPHGAALTH